MTVIRWAFLVALFWLPQCSRSNYNATVELKFPTKLYERYLNTQRSGKQNSPETTLQLLRDLYGCAQTNKRCAVELGALLFQGVSTESSRSWGSRRRHDRQGDSSVLSGTKNVTRAFALWRHAAQSGDPEAQYHLGLVYATYFNPPRFLMPPHSVQQQLVFKQLEKQPLDDNQTRDPADLHSVIDMLDLALDPLEVDRFYMTMDVLNLGSSPYGADVENTMTHAWQQHQEETLGQWNDKTTSRSTMTLDTFTTNVTEPALRMPLLRHISLATLYLYAAAQAGHIEAMNALGFRHLYGIGVPRRCSTAATYYMQVAREVAEFSTHGIPLATEAIRLSLFGLQAGLDDRASVSFTMRSHFSTLQLHVAESGDSAMQVAVAKKLLFGLDGFSQDFDKAAHFFSLAARQDRKEAVSYLGYLSVLGLGMPRDYDVAFKLFQYGALAPRDVLWYLYFRGTSTVQVNMTKAAFHFNMSAARGFPDAQYNLASLYIAGAGVSQSFPKAVMLLSKALEQGHAAAGYLLGVLHLNGFGTLRDCSVAAALFKSVAEKHPRISRQLRRAFELHQNHHLDQAAYHYWRLAEMGHELSQSNLGYLLDGGGVKPVALPYREASRPIDVVRSIMGQIPVIRSALFVPSSIFSLDSTPSIGINRAIAQRYWELAALQGSTEAYIRLGDYAYNGWGTDFATEDDNLHLELARALSHVDRNSASPPTVNTFVDSAGQSLTDWAIPHEETAYVARRRPSYTTAYGTEKLHSRIICDFSALRTRVVRNGVFQVGTTAADPRKLTYALLIVGQAEHNLARMHQLGQGVDQDLHIARRRLLRLTDATGAGVSVLPAKLTILLLQFHGMWIYLKERSFAQVLAEDHRALYAVGSTCAVLLMLVLRYHLAKVAPLFQIRY